MIEEIKAPNFTEGMGEAVISRLYFEIGAYVDEGDVLLDIETDKVVLELVAPFSGYIKSFDYAVGQLLQSEQVLGLIEEGAAPAVPLSNPLNGSAQSTGIEKGGSNKAKLVAFIIGVLIVVAILLSIR